MYDVRAWSSSPRAQARGPRPGPSPRAGLGPGDPGLCPGLGARGPWAHGPRPGNGAPGAHKHLPGPAPQTLTMRQYLIQSGSWTSNLKPPSSIRARKVRKPQGPGSPGNQLRHSAVCQGFFPRLRGPAPARARPDPKSRLLGALMPPWLEFSAESRNASRGGPKSLQNRVATSSDAPERVRCCRIQAAAGPRARENLGRGGRKGPGPGLEATCAHGEEPCDNRFTSLPCARPPTMSPPARAVPNGVRRVCGARGRRNDSLFPRRRAAAAATELVPQCRVRRARGA